MQLFLMNYCVKQHLISKLNLNIFIYLNNIYAFMHVHWDLRINSKELKMKNVFRCILLSH